MLGTVIDRAAWQANEPAQRRAVHDRATALPAHLLEFVLHAAPYPEQIDGHDAIVFRDRGIRGFDRCGLNAGIVEGRIQTPEPLYGLGDQGFDLCFIADIAGDRQYFVTGLAQRMCRTRYRRVVDIGHHHPGAEFGKLARGGQAHASRCTGHQSGFAVKVSFVHASIRP